MGVGTCTPNPTVQGQNVNCTFPLTGSTTGSYVLPPEGVYAGILSTNGGLYLGNSDLCIISGSTLTCNNVPVPINTDLGDRELRGHRPGIEWIYSRGFVTVNSPNCPNGATGLVSGGCAVCPSGSAFDSSNTCTVCSNGGCSNNVCNNGATNPPSCNTCTPSYYYDSLTSKCLFLQRVGVDFREFTPSVVGNGTTTGTWNSIYKTNNGTGYNSFKCDDVNTLVDPTHLNFDNRNYYGIKEICTTAKAKAISEGVANPRVFFYAYIYKQVNSSTGLTKYYSYVYTSYFDTAGNFIPWYSQAKVNDANSTGWSIYDVGGSKIG
jgi:hypothetical protein